MPDVTIATTTFYTTAAAGAGADDGSSFDDRTPIPTDIDALTINGTSPGTLATLFIVRESQNGHLKIATNGTGNFNNRGCIRTITDAQLNDDPAVPFTLEIGGIAGGNIPNSLSCTGTTALSHCFYGNDGAGGKTVNFSIAFSSPSTDFPDFFQQFSDSIVGNGSSNDITLGGSLYLKDSTYFTGGGVISSNTFAQVFYHNVITSGGIDFGSCGGTGVRIYKYGTIGPAGAFIDNFGESRMFLLRKATFTVEDSRGDPLPGIEVFAVDGLGYIASKYVTDANGKPQLQSRVDGNGLGLIYALGVIFVPEWVDEYHRDETGDQIKLESEAGEANRLFLSDATNKATFIFRDPTGTFETQTVQNAMTGDLVSTVTMTPPTVAGSVVLIREGS